MSELPIQYEFMKRIGDKFNRHKEDPLTKKVEELNKEEVKQYNLSDFYRNTLKKDVEDFFRKGNRFVNRYTQYNESGVWKNDGVFEFKDLHLINGRLDINFHDDRGFRFEHLPLEEGNLIGIGNDILYMKDKTSMYHSPHDSKEVVLKVNENLKRIIKGEVY